jgi:hypothetical protein
MQSKSTAYVKISGVNLPNDSDWERCGKIEKEIGHLGPCVALSVIM